MITDPGRQVWDEEILNAISKARDVSCTDGLSEQAVMPSPEESVILFCLFI
jgi:hypothetical protein